MSGFVKAMLLFAVLVVVGLVAAPQPTFAKDLFTDGTSGVDCSGAAQNSAVCAEHNTQTDPASGNDGLLAHITTIVAFASGMAAILVLIVGGINYITSNGDSAKVASAKTTVIYALIGLMVIVVARSIINYVVNRL